MSNINNLITFFPLTKAQLQICNINKSAKLPNGKLLKCTIQYNSDDMHYCINYKNIDILPILHIEQKQLIINLIFVHDKMLNCNIDLF